MTSIQRFVQITQAFDPEATRMGKPLTRHAPYLVTLPSRQRYGKSWPKASLKPRRQVSAIRFACER
jgi:hypothetical protein